MDRPMKGYSVKVQYNICDLQAHIVFNHSQDAQKSSLFQLGTTLRSGG